MVVNVGEPITFEVVVEGVPRPKIYWFCEKRKLHESRNVRMSEEEEVMVDADTQQPVKSVKCTLSMAEAREVDSGKYTVRAINGAGVKSSSVHLSVKGDYSLSSFPHYIPSSSVVPMLTPLPYVLPVNTSCLVVY